MHFESIFSFNVPVDCTYSTWYYSHHFTPTCCGMTSEDCHGTTCWSKVITVMCTVSAFTWYIKWKYLVSRLSAIIFEGYLSEFFYEWFLVFCDTLCVHFWVIGSPHSFVMSGASHSNGELHGIRLESIMSLLWTHLWMEVLWPIVTVYLYFIPVYTN